MRREKTNYIIQAVSHALDVLEQFSGADHQELGVTELSKRLKLHKNNVFRLLATLESRGYIEQNKATEDYRLGVRCLQLGQTFLGQVGILRQARSIIETLAHDARETAFVSVLRRKAVVPLDAVEADRPVRIMSYVGETLPLHCTAPGKAHLAFSKDSEGQDSLLNGLAKFTDKTITDRQALLEEIAKVCADGYSVELGEYLEDVNSVAVPIRDYTHTVVGTVTLTGPSYRLTVERIQKEIAPMLLKAGKELSARLGFGA